jgi:hypothetical protein
MAVFWRLILAHFIADFTFQTNKVASWKRESRTGMLVHILTHPVVAYALTWPYLSMTWVDTRWIQLNGWVCVALITLFHWLEDEWRVWSIQETGSPDSTGFFLWDQVVHITMILALSPTLSLPTVEPWVLPVLCVALLAHFVSVLIFFIENDLWGHSTVLGEKKYIFIGERLVGASLFLLPGPLFLLAFGWLGWIAYLSYYKSQERTWVHLVVGNTAVVLLGLFARGLLS